MDEEVVTKSDETEVPAESSVETPEAAKTQKSEGGDNGSQETYPDGAEVIVLEAEKAEGDNDEEIKTAKAKGDTEVAEGATPKSASEVVKSTIIGLESIMDIEGLPEDAKNAIQASVKSLGRLKSKGSPPKTTPSKEGSKETKKSEKEIDDGTEVSKAGRKISQARMTKIKTALVASEKATESLTTLLKELESEDSKETQKSDDVADSGSTPETTPAPANSDTIDVAAEVSKAVIDILKPMKEEILGKVKDVGDRVEAVERVHPASKSIEGGDTETQKSKEPFWGGLITGD